MKIWVNITDEDGTLRERFSVGTDSDCDLSFTVEATQRAAFRYLAVERDIGDRVGTEIMSALAAEVK